MISEGRHPVNQPPVSSDIRGGLHRPLPHPGRALGPLSPAEWTMKTLSLPAEGCDSQALTLSPRYPGHSTWAMSGAEFPVPSDTSFAPGLWGRSDWPGE